MKPKRYKKGEKIKMHHTTREENKHVGVTKHYTVEGEYPHFVLCSYIARSGDKLHACFTRDEIERQRIN